jgi:adenylate cyclase
MKRCPQCNRIESDDALAFCRVDGARLVSDTLDSESSATLSLPSLPRSADLPTPQLDNRPSIAVLSFVNMSADPENEYFCDGLAEELLNALAKIDDLKVAARTSSFAFKASKVSVDQIGQQLHVNAILEGSVRRAGNRLRITVQLINASDGYHIWSERYDRELQDIFEVQDEITLAVVKALKVKLLGDEKDAVLKRYTNNAEAYQLYLRGRFFFFKRTAEGFNKAIECFEQAIKIDSEYALAFSGLADCYTFLGFYEIIAPAQASEKVRAAAFKALELDDSLAETHTSLAFYLTTYEWNFAEAERHFKQALEINPRYALAYHLLSANLIFQGIVGEGIAAEIYAIELEPFTVIFNAALAWWYYLGRRNAEAIAQALKTIDLAPNHFFAHWVLGLAHAQDSRYDEAIASLQRAASLIAFNQHILGDLGRVYALNGQPGKAEELIANLTSSGTEGHVFAVNIAKIYVGLGDKEAVFAWFEKAFAEHSVRLPWSIVDPAVDSMRDDPRFQDLRRRIGLEH